MSGQAGYRDRTDVIIVPVGTEDKIRLRMFFRFKWKFSEKLAPSISSEEISPPRVDEEEWAAFESDHPGRLSEPPCSDSRVDWRLHLSPERIAAIHGLSS